MTLIPLTPFLGRSESLLLGCWGWTIFPTGCSAKSLKFHAELPDITEPTPSLTSRDAVKVSACSAGTEPLISFTRTSYSESCCPEGPGRVFTHFEHVVSVSFCGKISHAFVLLCVLIFRYSSYSMLFPNTKPFYRFGKDNWLRLTSSHKSITPGFVETSGFRQLWKHQFRLIHLTPRHSQTAWLSTESKQMNCWGEDSQPLSAPEEARNVPVVSCTAVAPVKSAGVVLCPGQAGALPVQTLRAGQIATAWRVRKSPPVSATMWRSKASAATKHAVSVTGCKGKRLWICSSCHPIIILLSCLVPKWPDCSLSFPF